MVEKALAENEVNTLLQRRVAELEAANAQMRSELDHSSETLTTLQSKFKEKDKMCEHLKCRNVALCNEKNEARDNIETLQKKLAKIEEDAAASSTVTKEHFKGYCDKIVQDMTSLHEAYECNVNSIGGLSRPSSRPLTVRLRPRRHRQGRTSVRKPPPHPPRSTVRRARAGPRNRGVSPLFFLLESNS
jgi:FtsZ-binding cell division protein ZapB